MVLLIKPGSKEGVKNKKIILKNEDGGHNMRNFTKQDIEKYWEYVYENLFDKEQANEEIRGHCHICGEILNQVELPSGPVSEICCLNCLEYFNEQFEEINIL